MRMTLYRTVLAGMLLAVPVSAQTLLVGATGGQSFNNAWIGPAIAAELPFRHHWEFDPEFSIAPECKNGYGCGWQSDVSIGGIGTMAELPWEERKTCMSIYNLCGTA